MQIRIVSGPNRSKIPYGSRFGSDENGKNHQPEKVMKTKENPSESMDYDGFMVAGEEFDPSTSGL